MTSFSSTAKRRQVRLTQPGKRLLEITRRLFDTEAAGVRTPVGICARCGPGQFAHRGRCGPSSAWRPRCLSRKKQSGRQGDHPRRQHRERWSPACAATTPMSACSARCPPAASSMWWSSTPRRSSPSPRKGIRPPGGSMSFAELLDYSAGPAGGRLQDPQRSSKRGRRWPASPCRHPWKRRAARAVRENRGVGHRRYRLRVAGRVRRRPAARCHHDPRARSC